jgi:hypothetical protein
VANAVRLLINLHTLLCVRCRCMDGAGTDTERRARLVQGRPSGAAISPPVAHAQAGREAGQARREKRKALSYRCAVDTGVCHASGGRGALLPVRRRRCPFRFSRVFFWFASSVEVEGRQGLTGKARCSRGLTQ